ncbi:hypothetical protein ANTPLA_LOCUS4937 [Anthophora plagiata]
MIEIKRSKGREDRANRGLTLTRGVEEERKAEAKADGTGTYKKHEDLARLQQQLWKYSGLPWRSCLPKYFYKRTIPEQKPCPPCSGRVPGAPTAAQKLSTLGELVMHGVHVNTGEVNTRVGDTPTSIGPDCCICTAALVISILVRRITMGLPLSVCFRRVSILLTPVTVKRMSRQPKYDRQ